MAVLKGRYVSFNLFRFEQIWPLLEFHSRVTTLVPTFFWSQINHKQVAVHVCSRLYIVMMTSSIGNIFRIIGLLCGNSLVTGEFPSQRPVRRNFGVFFDLGINKQLSKQSRHQWLETQLRSLWCHCNVVNALKRNLCKCKRSLCLETNVIW